MTSASWGGATSCCSSGSHILTLPQGSSPHLRGAEERDPGEGNLERGKTSPISGAPTGGVYFSALISSFKRGLAGNSGGLLCGVSPLFLHKDSWPEAAMRSHDRLHHPLVYLFRGPAFRKGTVLGAELKRSLAIVTNNIDSHEYSR